MASLLRTTRLGAQQMSKLADKLMREASRCLDSSIQEFLIPYLSVLQWTVVQVNLATPAIRDNFV